MSGAGAAPPSGEQQAYRADNRYEWLIGSPFLRNVYSVYDAEKGQHGLAPLTEAADMRYGEAYNPMEDGVAGGGASSPHSPNAGGGEGTTEGGSSGTGSGGQQPQSGAGRARISALLVGVAVAAWCW